MHVGRGRTTRLGVVLMASVIGTGCHSWHRPPTGAAETVASLRPDRVRLTLLDTATVVVRSPEVRADSIVGTLDRRDRPPVAVPIGQVSGTEVRRFSTGRTLALIAASPFILLAAAYMLFTPSGGWY